LCDKHRISPTQFYQWQKLFFENGAAAFEKVSKRKAAAEEMRIMALEAKVRDKNEVIAEILEDHVKLKKELGEL